jgi:hypothetical protein
MVFVSFSVCALVLVATCSGHESANDDGADFMINAPEDRESGAIPLMDQPALGGRERRSTDCGITSAFTSEQKDTAVSEHNRLRAQEQSAAMLKMSWDDGLAARAQEWASQCRWKHGMASDCDGNAAGQNLYISWAPGYPQWTVEKALSAWYNEKQYWTANVLNNGTCQTGKVCGHYTQMVWSTSARVGCGYALCETVALSDSRNVSDAVFVVCDYSPPGNWRGLPVFPVGKACTECWTLTRKDATNPGYLCDNGHFCESCNPANDPECQCGPPVECLNGGVWSDKDCRCHCVNRYYGDACETACEDLKPTSSCEYFQSVDYCETSSIYYSFMTKNCAKTCGFC